MPSHVDSELAKSVAGWVTQQAQTLNISVEAFPDGVSQEGDWLSVPVAVRQGEDAYERASLLQQIEDAWEPNNHNGLQLLLVPAKAVKQTLNDDYARVGELMARQNQIFDRIGEMGSVTEDAERFQTVRQEWEETLREMERLYPRLKNEVA